LPGGAGAPDLRDFALWVIITLSLLALVTLFQNPAQRTDATGIPFSQLLNEVDQGRVRDVSIFGQEVRGTYTDGRSFQSYAPSDPARIQRLYQKGVSVTIRPHESEQPWFVPLLVSWLPFAVLIGVWIFLWRRGQAAGGAANQSSQEIASLKRQMNEMEKRLDQLSGKDKS
jgi:cell division protease FtsH